MLDSLILAEVQFVILLTELKKVLNQELKCLCSKTQSYWNEPFQQLWMWVPHIFIALEINRYIVQKCTYTV